MRWWPFAKRQQILQDESVLTPGGSSMNDMAWLIEGLLRGDPTAIAVGAFAAVGTAVIVAVVAVIRARRSRGGG